MVAPTLAWQFAPKQAIGIAPIFAYQRFSAEGLQAFDNAPGFPPFTSAPGYVTNNGYDTSTGWGVRIGYQGEFDGFRLGAVYSSKMSMGNFDNYKGLFAEQGGFDIPASYGLGAAYTGLPNWTFAFDWVYIDYSGVAVDPQSGHDRGAARCQQRSRIRLGVGQRVQDRRRVSTRCGLDAACRLQLHR